MNVKFKQPVVNGTQVKLALIAAFVTCVTVGAPIAFTILNTKLNSIHDLTNTNFTEQKTRIAQLEATIKALGNVSPAPIEVPKQGGK